MDDRSSLWWLAYDVPGPRKRESSRRAVHFCSAAALLEATGTFESLRKMSFSPRYIRSSDGSTPARSLLERCESAEGSFTCFLVHLGDSKLLVASAELEELPPLRRQFKLALKRSTVFSL